MTRALAPVLLLALAVGCAGRGAAGGGGEAAAGAPAGTRRSAPDIRAKVGVQLYSVRGALETDLDAGLRRLRALGVSRVEVHKLVGRTAAEFRAALDRAGLAAPGMMTPFDRLAADLPGVVADARALGASFVTCPWIPHEGSFDEADARRAIDIFGAAGRALRAAGLRLTYHVHGYELFPPGLGTTPLDRMIAGTAPGEVDFEMDVFYMAYGGADPVAYLRRHPGRFPLVHLKDRHPGTPPGTTGKVDPAHTVALGEGTIRWGEVIAAAEAQGTAFYFIEDEHPSSFDSLARSLAYLDRLVGAAGTSTR